METLKAQKALDGLGTKRTDLDAQIEQQESQIADKRAALGAAVLDTSPADVERAQTEINKLETRLTQLKAAAVELETRTRSAEAQLKDAERETASKRVNELNAAIEKGVKAAFVQWSDLRSSFKTLGQMQGELADLQHGTFRGELPPATDLAINGYAQMAEQNTHEFQLLEGTIKRLNGRG